MQHAACPTADELSAFQQGTLPEATLVALAGHLEHCPRCEAAARGLDASSDTVVQALRRAARGSPLSPLGAPPRRVGDYDILGELGHGGMGIVYRARHRRLGRLVALKMLRDGAFVDADDRARFRAEAEAVARLSHPHIVQIYEVGEHDAGAGLPRPYFTLELADGGDLADRLAGRPQPPRQAASWVEAVARAAHYAHERGVVHRDLKPSNVLLTADGEPKLCDFGVAKFLTRTNSPTTHGTVLGTAEYMAPEQAKGTGAVGPAADIYALGAILYTSLTGHPPFQGTSPWLTLEQVVHQEPVPPRRLQPGVPRDLETICLKCLQKEPGRRYASAADLAEDLRRSLADRPIRARSPAPAERLGRWCRRNPLAASLLLAVTLGAAGGMWSLSRLSESLVRFSALEGAAQHAETFDEVHDFYTTHVVDRLDGSGVEATHAYATRSHAVPAPATFTIDLGRQMSRHSPWGMEFRLYSDAPFRFRKDGGPRDDFEKEALRHLKEDPHTPFYRFEDYGGRPVLRYAAARVMGEKCVKCHNSHPDSPRGNWRVGDMRGVQEVIRPLANDVARTREGFRGTLALVGGLTGGLLLLSCLVLVVGNRRRPPRIGTGR
jgi:serine/threonine protein kinase